MTTTKENIGNISVSDIKFDIKKNINKIEGAFPIDVFPSPIADFIKDANSALNFDIDFFGGSILSTLSLAIGNRFRVKIKEGWVVKCNLYVAIVGSPGDGKSHVMREAFLPLMEQETNNIKLFQEDWKTYTSNGFQGEKPIQKRFYLNDFTMESLTKIHSENPLGIGVFADELLGWLGNMNKYNSGSDLEAWLEFWNGGNKVNDTKGGGTTFIESSFVSVIGGIQPAKVKSIINQNLEGNGFAYRILWASSKNRKFIPETDLELNLQHKENYKNLINHILSYRDLEKDHILELNEQAKIDRQNWWNSFGEEHYHKEPYIHQTSIKIKEYFNRFLIILAIVHCASEELQNNYTREKLSLKVDEDIVSKSIILAEYFMRNALLLRTEISDPLKSAGRNVKEWYSKLPYNLTTKEAVELSANLNISKSTIEKKLADLALFKKTGHGTYHKTK